MGWRIRCLGLVTALAGLASIAFGRLSLEGHDTQAVAMKEVLLVPPADVIRRLDLGYHSLAADLLFVRANLYYGEHILGDEQLPWLSAFIDVLLEVDPDFKKPYLWGALVTLFTERQVSNVTGSQVRRANAILMRGAERFPDDFQFPMRIGYNLYYELGLLGEALPYLARAADLPGAPPDIRKKLPDILMHTGDRELAQVVLTTILAENQDETLDASIRGRMILLLDPERRAVLTRLRNELVAEWRSEFQYLPYDLFLVVREP